MYWLIKCWFNNRRQIEKIEDLEQKKTEYRKYAKELGVNLESIDNIFSLQERSKEFFQRIGEAERDWRTTSLALLSAIVAIISAIAAWTAVFIHR